MSNDECDEVEYEIESFSIASHIFSITTVSFMPIERLLDLQSQSQEISGQKLWCGSLCVMQYLLETNSFVCGLPVVELGAGTGLVGMLCSKLGAKSVILTDNDTKSICHMHQDCSRNQVNCEVVNLNWFKFDLKTIPELHRISLEPIRIVAGDVLYKPMLIAPFFKLVKSLLEMHEYNEMLLCHVPRAGVTHEHVISAAESQSLLIVPIDSCLWRKGVVYQYSPEDDYTRAQLYKLTNLQGILASDFSSVKTDTAIKSDELQMMSEANLSANTLSHLSAHLKHNNDKNTPHKTQIDVIKKAANRDLNEKNWVDAKNEEYKEQWYWDARFEDEESFEWLLSFKQIEKYLLPYLKLENKILVIGCGNSSLSNDLYDLGYTNIINIDYSGTVISKMRQASLQAGRFGMEWIEMNMLTMTFADDTFDIVIDKATMDALMVDEGDVWDPTDSCKLQSNELCVGISRVLKTNGCFLQISFAQPHFRSKYLMGAWIAEDKSTICGCRVGPYESLKGHCELYGWTLSVETVDLEAGSLNSFLYVMLKDTN